jgi:hypothetical protein
LSSDLLFLEETEVSREHIYGQNEGYHTAKIPFLGGKTRTDEFMVICRKIILLHEAAGICSIFLGN